MRRCRRPDRFIIARMPGDPLSNNGNGEGIQVDIEPRGRLLRRCTKRAEQTTRARGCSSLGDPETFSLLKEKELCAHLSPSPLPDPGRRLLSRLCLETRSSEFLAERRPLLSASFHPFSRLLLLLTTTPTTSIAEGAPQTPGRVSRHCARSIRLDSAEDYDRTRLYNATRRDRDPREADHSAGGSTVLTVMRATTVGLCVSVAGRK